MSQARRVPVGTVAHVRDDGSVFTIDVSAPASPERHRYGEDRSGLPFRSGKGAVALLGSDYLANKKCGGV